MRKIGDIAREICRSLRAKKKAGRLGTAGGFLAAPEAPGVQGDNSSTRETITEDVTALCRHAEPLRPVDHRAIRRQKVDGAPPQSPVARTLQKRLPISEYPVTDRAADARSIAFDGAPITDDAPREGPGATASAVRRRAAYIRAAVLPCPNSHDQFPYERKLASVETLKEGAARRNASVGDTMRAADARTRGERATCGG